jgi:hypothetical protein
MEAIEAVQYASCDGSRVPTTSRSHREVILGWGIMSARLVRQGGLSWLSANADVPGLSECISQGVNEAILTEENMVSTCGQPPPAVLA